MKSFADWTDEIRALMNPPAPMVDTCNMADSGSILDTLLQVSAEISALETGTAIHHAIENAHGLTRIAAAARNAARTGRHSGKSAIRNEWYEKAMEIMANTDFRGLEQRIIQNGTALWGVDFGKDDGDYTVGFHDANERDPWSMWKP
jgi:hypothetical protein